MAVKGFRGLEWINEARRVFGRQPSGRPQWLVPWNVERQVPQGGWNLLRMRARLPSTFARYHPRSPATTPVRPRASKRQAWNSVDVRDAAVALHQTHVSSRESDENTRANSRTTFSYPYPATKKKNHPFARQNYKLVIILIHDRNKIK